MYIQETYKGIYKLILCTFLFCYFQTLSIPVFAQQTFDIRLHLNNVDCDTRTACYDVQIRSSDGSSWGLAGQNYRLYYDASLAAFQSGSTQLGAQYQQFNLVQDVQDVNAAGTGSLTFESSLGFLNYAIDLNNTSTGGLTVDGNWLTTSQLCFLMEPSALTDPATCFEVVWSRDAMTSTYATSFVEVSEWVQAESTTLAVGATYQDIVTTEASACLANTCSSTSAPTTNSYDIQLIAGNTDCASNTICYDVQLSNTSGNEWSLAGQNYRLYYDATQASWVSGVSRLSNLYTDFTVEQNQQDVNATGTGSLPFESNLSFLNYFIDLGDLVSGGTALPINGDWLTTSSLCFEMEVTAFDQSEICFDAVWGRAGLTDEYATSFVEVAECIQPDKKVPASATTYHDLESSDADDCITNPCRPNNTYDIQLVSGNVDCASNTICYDVQLRSTTGVTWALAGQNYRLYYDATQASWVSGTSALPNLYTAFTLEEDQQDLNASGTGTLPFESNLGFLNYYIDLIDLASDGTSLPANGDWVTTSNLCFEMETAVFDQPDICFDAVWGRAGLTENYATSFVEVAECVQPDKKVPTSATSYHDLESTDANDCIASPCRADGNFGIQLALNNCDCNSGTVCYDVQVQSADGTARGLGGQNYRLYYDASLATWISGSSSLPSSYDDFVLEENSHNTNSTGTGSLSFESSLGFLNYHIDLEDVFTGGIILSGDGSWTTTSQICFEMEATVFENPNTCFDAVWGRSGLTDTYATSFVEISEWTSSGQVSDGVVVNHVDLTSNNCFVDKAPVTHTIDTTICDNQAYPFAGLTLNTTGTYRDTLSGTIACDSIVILNLSVVTQLSGSETASICEGASYTFNGTTYSAAGTYTANLTAASGCDSVATLHLSVLPQLISSETTSICEGASYTFNGTTYSTAGTYTVNLTSASGCDSVAVLNLSVLPQLNDSETVSICEGESYTFNGTTYSTAGTYTINTISDNGCSNSTTLTIIALSGEEEIRNETICAGTSYIINGETFTQAGSYEITTPSQTGCSGKIILNLDLKSCVDLALTKNLAANQPDTVRIGDIIDYQICVVNEGITPAYNIAITDHIPNGLKLHDSSEGWTEVSSDKATYLIEGPLGTGMQICAVIRLEIEEGSSGLLTNKAEITGVTDEEGVLIEDIDSTPEDDTEDINEDDEDTQEVYFDACPILHILPLNRTICEGESVTIQGIGGSNSAQYKWDENGVMSCLECQSTTVTPSVSTTYSIIVTESSGCSTAATTTVTVLPKPVVELSDQEICAGTTTQLFSGFTSGTFQWIASDGSSVEAVANPVVSPTTNTEYCLTVIDENGCSNSHCMMVTVKEVLQTTINETTCAGKAYFFNGQFLETTGTYQVRLVSENGCDSMVTVNLEVLPATITQQEKILCSNTSFTYNGTFIDAPGVYPLLFKTTTGCDSLVNLTVIERECIDLALSKSLANPDIIDIHLGDLIDYTICVTNEGASPAYNVKVYDHLPAGMTLTSQNTGWAMVDNQKAVNTVAGPINSNQTVCIDIQLLLAEFPTETSSIRNIAEIGEVKDVQGNILGDIDSTPEDDTSLEEEISLEDDEGIAAIIFNPCPAVQISPINPSICPTTSIPLTVSGGSNVATYEWLPTTGLSCSNCPAPTATPAIPTTYCVTVREPSGCSETTCTSVNIYAPAMVDVVGNRTICTGTSTTLQAIGGVNYRWSPPTGIIGSSATASLTVAPTSTTNYAVFMTDQNGCTDFEEVTVTVESCTDNTINPCNLQAIACEDKTICADDIDGVRLVVNGGSSWQWSPSIGLDDPTAPAPYAKPTVTTTYTVTATDANGCIATDQVVVEVINCNNTPNPCNSTAVVCPDKQICAGDQVRLVVNGGSSWFWTPSTGLNDPTAPTPYAAPTTTTAYTVVAIDNNGCTSEAVVLITVNDCSTPDPCLTFGTTASPDQIICRGETANLSVTGGSSWLWSPSNTLNNSISPTPIATPQTTTTYTVQTTDINGCVATDQVTIFVENTVSIFAGNDISICAGATPGQLQASAATNYQWSPVVGLSNSNIANPMVNPTTTTTYTVRTTSVNGCTATDQVNVIVQPTPTINAGANVTICRGESATMNATGGSNYTWIPSTGLSNSNIANPIAAPQITTTYTVQSTNANGCVAKDQVTVFVVSTGEVSAGNDVSICTGTTTALQATGGNSYTWSPSIGLSNTNIANPIASPTTNTIYCVTVTTNDGCTVTDCITVTVQEAASVEACEDKDICTSEAVQLVVTNAVNYQWAPAATLDNPFSGTPTANPAYTTTYYVTVTDENGCTSVDDVTVNVGNTSADLGPDRTICSGTSIPLSAGVGGVSYQWSPTNGLNNLNIATIQATPTASTTYCVTITDVTGCTATDCINIQVTDAQAAVACEDKEIRVGESIRLNVTTGASYLWLPSNSLDNPTSPVPVASPTTTTTYTVIVTDRNGCTSQDNVTVYVTNTLGRVALRAKAFLQGPMNTAENLMRDDLRANGYLPLKEPYSGLAPFEGMPPCFVHVGGGGEERTTQAILDRTGSEAIVDWVFLELHDANQPEKVLATRSALLQRNGDIVEVDGESPVLFRQVPSGDYYIAIRHRNHLGIMTEQPISFSDAAQTIDFTDPNQTLYQLKDAKLLSKYPAKKVGDFNCLWGGNSNSDRRIIFQGPGLDQSKLFFDVYSHPENSGEGIIPNLNFIIKGYCQGDNNMDGELKYQGPGNDVDNLQFFNVILHEENLNFMGNKIIYEQIPLEE